MQPTRRTLTRAIKGHVDAHAESTHEPGQQGSTMGSQLSGSAVKAFAHKATVTLGRTYPDRPMGGARRTKKRSRR